MHRYFAEDPAYVDAHYAYREDPVDKTTGTMLIVHVLCGLQKDFGMAIDKTLRRPPCVPGRPLELYDSVKVRVMCMYTVYMHIFIYAIFDFFFLWGLSRVDRTAGQSFTPCTRWLTATLHML